MGVGGHVEQSEVAGALGGGRADEFPVAGLQAALLGLRSGGRGTPFLSTN